MNNFDEVEEKIEIEQEFRKNVLALQSNIDDIQKNSILPYNINIEDVFNIVQDIKWNEFNKFVVFFNIEFCLSLLKLGVQSRNITYIAPDKETRNIAREALRCNTILFDLNTYKRHGHRKKWKKYLMKKIGKADEFIAVGNIPFTVNDSDSKNSKKVGNDFIKLMNQFKKSAYILPAKFHTKTFKNQVILNNDLQKMVYHKKSLFDIAGDVYTCHIVNDSENKTNKFSYTDNISNKSVELNKDTGLVMSKNLNGCYVRSKSKMTFADLWVRGDKYGKELNLKEGKYKVVWKVGRNDKTDNLSYRYSDEEDTTLGKWKVVIANQGGGTAVKIANPDVSIPYCIVAFPTKDEKTAIRLKEYMQTDEFVTMWKNLKTNNSNTKTVFSKIEIPDGLI